MSTDSFSSAEMAPLTRQRVTYAVGPSQNSGSKDSSGRATAAAAHKRRTRVPTPMPSPSWELVCGPSISDPYPHCWAGGTPLGLPEYAAAAEEASQREHSREHATALRRRLGKVARRRRLYYLFHDGFVHVWWGWRQEKEKKKREDKDGETGGGGSGSGSGSGSSNDGDCEYTDTNVSTAGTAGISDAGVLVDAADANPDADADTDSNASPAAWLGVFGYDSVALAQRARCVQRGAQLRMTPVDAVARVELRCQRLRAKAAEEQDAEEAAEEATPVPAAAPRRQSKGRKWYGRLLPAVALAAFK